MKAMLFLLSLFFFATSYSQFVKNEKLIGGNVDILTIREKNPGVTASGPFGSTPSKETYISIRPEFSYIIGKNTGLSIFGEYLSSVYSDISNGNEFKTKGYTIGAGLTKYRFFTNEFGVLGKIQISYSPSWSRFYDTTSTFYPRDSYYLTNASLVPGLFYRFSEHFSLQATIGEISYDHLKSKREGFDGSQVHNQFSIGFTNISFGAFYIFK